LRPGNLGPLGDPNERAQHSLKYRVVRVGSKFPIAKGLSAAKRGIKHRV